MTDNKIQQIVDELDPDLVKCSECNNFRNKGDVYNINIRDLDKWRKSEWKDVCAWCIDDIQKK